MLVAPHNVGGPVLTAANLHLAACTPNFKIQEHFNDFADDEVLAGRARAPAGRRGRVLRRCPPRPGLGVTLDVDFVAERPSTGAHFDLFAARLALPGNEVMAVQIPAPGVIALVDVPVGEPGPGEALVRVAYAGICGSDRELLEGGRPAEFVRYPVVPGHEWSGVVEAVGAGVGPAARRPQGRRRGLPQLPGLRRVPERARRRCARRPTRRPASPSRARGTTHLRLPARLLHVLPDDADLRAAALLEPAACVAEACLLAAPVPGERVAVVGGGTLGLLSAQLLRASSPRELVVVARRAERAALARRMGADRAGRPG